jgi:hypothetical protein
MREKRKIKVYRKFRSSNGMYGSAKELPWISISSVWLEKYGFKVGSCLELTIEKNKIIIDKSPSSDCNKQ